MCWREKKRTVALAGLVIALFACALPAVAADPADDSTAVTVNGTPIKVAEVDRQMSQFLGERLLAKEAEPVFRAQMLQQLIDRQLILTWLKGNSQTATEAEVDLEVERFTRELALREVTLVDFLAERQLSLIDLERSMFWRLSWTKFLKRYLTDENLERFFQERRRQFDGTRLRVAHILLAVKSPPERPATEAQIGARVAEAKELRKKITGGSLSFAEAAKQFSDAPTGADGGVIGLISRDGPMPESFTAPAFELPATRISDPVVTPFGVHLIQCLEVMPGAKTWQDARAELEPAMKRYLFDWAAGKERSEAEITFGADVPHFRPGTRQLAD